MKKKKNVLTKYEERLLEYPPTEKTWICKCKSVNSGKWEVCLWCQLEKPAKPELLWPKYLKACEKVGILPLTVRWKLFNKTPMVFPKEGNKWITQMEFQQE